MRTTADLSDPSCTLVVMVTELSWRLKIRRAEEHFNELQKLVEAYQAGHHYRAVCPNPAHEEADALAVRAGDHRAA
jgi:hypothetical protein